MLNEKRMLAIKRIAKDEKEHIAQFHRLRKDSADDKHFGRLSDHTKKERFIKLLVKNYPYLDGETYKPVACPEAPQNIYKTYSNEYAQKISC